MLQSLHDLEGGSRMHPSFIKLFYILPTALNAYKKIAGKIGC